MVDEDKNLGETVGFTPGPWKIETPRDREEGEAGGWDETYPRGVAVRADWSAPVNGLLGYEICRLSGVNDHTLPDARLIAAAPALYEALAGLAFSYDARDKGDGCWCYVARDETHFERTGKHDDWCLRTRAAFALVDKPATESAKRPISDEANQGQAS